MALNERGQEIPDPTPIEIPSGLKRPLSIHEEIKRFVRLEMSRQAEAGGLETFEEADDFEVDDGEIDDLPTIYQIREAYEMAPETGPEGPESLDGDPNIPTPQPPEKNASNLDNQAAPD